MSKKIHIKKTKQKAIATGGILLASAVVGFSIYQTILNDNKTNATTNDSLLSQQRGGGYIRENFDGLKTFDIKSTSESSDNLFSEISGDSSSKVADSNLPAKYDPRDNNSGNFLTRQENQAYESTCWAYAFTTTAETYLVKKNIAVGTELSSKHLDYITAAASSALKESSAKNKYSEYIKTISDDNTERTVGDGGNYMIAMAASTGKYALTSDASFFDKMKLNDATNLGSATDYGSFILDYEAIYDVKQKTADVFSSEDAEYFVDGANYIGGNDVYYSLNADQDESQKESIQKIKEAINNYGAVAVLTNYNESKCMYSQQISGTEFYNRTIIDRSTSDTSTACDDVYGSTAHGVTLVGWDDNWAYIDNGTAKTGAFIVQNSYGAGDNYYLSYNSPLVAFVISSMGKSEDFDEILDMTDYQQTIDGSNYTITYNYSNTDQKTLKEIVFSIADVVSTPDSVFWDIYAKSGDKEYKKIGSVDAGTGHDQLFYENISDLTTNFDGNISIQIRLNAGNYELVGLNSDVFNDTARYFTTALYLDDGNVVVTCPTGQKLNDNEECEPIVCPTGQKLNGNDCEAIVCSAGQKLEGNDCIDVVPTCSDDEELVNNECKKKTASIVCADDETLVDGECKKKTTTVVCATDEELKDGECQKKTTTVSDIPETSGGEEDKKASTKTVGTSDTGIETQEKSFAIENAILISGSVMASISFAIVFLIYEKNKR